MIGPVSAVQVPALWAGSTDPRTWTGVGTLAANFAVLNAFTVSSPITVSTAYYYVSIQSGNIWFGIYDSDGVVLAATGAFACPVAGPATRALTASLTLTPGRVYYSAYEADNGTVSIQKMIANFNPSILVNGSARFVMMQNNFAFFPPSGQITMPGTSTLHVLGLVFA